MPENELKQKIEASTFRKIIKHLQENKDLQNIDLMKLAGFCRNCISKWYMESSKEYGDEMDYDEAKKNCI